MEETNNENFQNKYESSDRPTKFVKPYSFDYDWKKPYDHDWNKPWQNPYGQKWQHSYGPKWPYCSGPFCPGSYYGGYNWPWLLLALKSINPRDLLRYIDEMDSMGM